MKQNNTENIEPRAFFTGEAFYIYLKTDIYSSLHSEMTQDEVELNLSMQWKKLNRQAKYVQYSNLFERYELKRRLYNKQRNEAPLSAIQNDENISEDVKESKVQKNQKKRKTQKKKYQRKKRRSQKPKKPIKPASIHSINQTQEMKIDTKINQQSSIHKPIENDFQPSKTSKRSLKNNKTQAKFNILKKAKNMNEESEVIPNLKPVPQLDFLNSANLIEHISVLSISTQRSNQGQIGLDVIKSVISHSYGVMNFTDIQDLQLQLFFEIAFHPRQNGSLPDNTYCTAKQAGLYCYDLAKNYLITHKDIFTKDTDYYLN